MHTFFHLGEKYAFYPLFSPGVRVKQKNIHPWAHGIPVFKLGLSPDRSRVSGEELQRRKRRHGGAHHQARHKGLNMLIDR